MATDANRQVQDKYIVTQTFFLFKNINWEGNDSSLGTVDTEMNALVWL